MDFLWSLFGILIFALALHVLHVETNLDSVGMGLVTILAGCILATIEYYQKGGGIDNEK